MNATASAAFHILERQTSGIANQFNKESLSDCKIRFKKSNNVLHLHKLILCQQSEFFDRCFQNGMKESQDGILEIEDEDEPLFTSLIEMIYTVKIRFKDDDLLELLTLAEKYQLHGLVQSIVADFASRLTDKNVLECTKLDLKKYPILEAAFSKKIKQIRYTLVRNTGILSVTYDQLLIVLEAAIDSSIAHVGIDLARKWIDAHPLREEHMQHLIDTLNKLSKRAPLITFTSKAKHSVIFNADKTKITKTCTNTQILKAMPTPHFNVRLLTECTGLQIGMRTKNYDDYFLRIGKTGSCYCLTFEITVIHQPCDQEGTIIEVVREDDNIRFIVDNIDYGVMYIGVRDACYPVFETSSPCSFEFIQ